jgi:hypothetical protein
MSEAAMQPVTETHTRFSPEDVRGLEPAMKIGILATVNPEGLPHLTMISTLKASRENQLSFGQFMEGQSKAHLRQNPKAGWLVMSLDRQVWRGKAAFTHTSNSGPDFDFYNNSPLFRYNAYFGVHTVYYLDLIEHTGKASLPMNRVVFAAIQTLLRRSLPSRRSARAVLNPWTIAFLNKLDHLKFVAYVAADGYPVVIPAIQAQASGADRVIFSTSVYTAELARIPAGASLAVFALSLSMEDVLLRGRYLGQTSRLGIRCGSVVVDWVYNSMPPVPGQIYPPLPVQEVRQF